MENPKYYKLPYSSTPPIVPFTRKRQEQLQPTMKPIAISTDAKVKELNNEIISLKKHLHTVCVDNNLKCNF
jgi:hypothetical protein